MTVQYLLSYNLLRLRNERGLTQAEAAEKADLSLRMYQTLEYQKGWLSAQTIDKLAKGFKVSPSELFADVKPKPSITIEYLLKALEELNKENERLKSK